MRRKDGHPLGVAVAIFAHRSLSRSVHKDDTTTPPPTRNPSNHIPVHNEDCVIMTPSLKKDDISPPLPLLHSHGFSL